MDAVSAFLNELLNEEIYLRICKKYEDRNQLWFCFKGQQNAIAAWTELSIYTMVSEFSFESFIITLGFKQSKVDTCNCQYKRVTNLPTTLLAIYVNDLLIASYLLRPFSHKGNQ